MVLDGYWLGLCLFGWIVSQVVVVLWFDCLVCWCGILVHSVILL